jgi:hypothetical protein
MKRLALFLFVFSAISLKAQTIVGVNGSYNGHVSKSYIFEQYSNFGVYVTSPIWKKLSFNTGANFLNNSYDMAFWYEPWLYPGVPEGTASGKVKTGILEIPVDLVISLYKDSESKMKAYFHAGYSLGRSIYSKENFYNRDHKLISTSLNKFGNPWYHNINFEMEFRWLILKKYTLSYFICDREGAYSIQNQNRWYWTNYLGTGIRFGFILPKKAKE